jgi:D-alanyl-D-alanine carboxypeptidase
VPPPRSVALAAVLAAVLSLPLVSTPQGLASPQVERDTVEGLRRQAAQTAKDLEKATKEWEGRKKKLTQSEERLRQTLSELGAAQVELNKLREPLARLANSAYKVPGASGLPSMLGSRDPGQALRSAADIQHLASQRESIVRRASGLRQQRTQLAAQAQALQSNNAVEQAKLGQEVAELKRRSAETTRQLSEMLKKIRADRERRFVLGCSQVKVAEARRYPNGLIPDRFLCDLPQRGDQLRADAALAFFKLNSAYRKRFGQQMCVTDSYRNLASQQRVYAQKPGLAAVPGRSNHGTGTAVDLCGGVQTQGSAQFRWLEANSRKYGWFHPQWAYSSPFEPWHWEFGSESD